MGKKMLLMTPDLLVPDLSFECVLICLFVAGEDKAHPGIPVLFDSSDGIYGQLQTSGCILCHLGI